MLLRGLSLSFKWLGSACFHLFTPQHLRRVTPWSPLSCPWATVQPPTWCLFIYLSLLFLFLIQFPHNSLSDLSKHNTPWFKTFPRAWVVIQSLSHVRLFATPWTAAHQASLSFTISWSLLKPMSIEWMMPSITGLRENSKTDQDPAGPSEVKKCPSLFPISHL